MSGSTALASVNLEDKYVLDRGRIYLTGTQALVRMAFTQRRRDVAAGLNTAGYISGYRGSPLGGFDQALVQARGFVAQHHIHFRPGVNEDIAATAVWGTQQNDLFGDAIYHGVFAVWYGKGPGVDRSGDALRHANLAGTSRYGGVLALAGDDHTCKSSTTAHHSEYALIDAGIPVLAPSDVQELLDFGLHGWAMSRYSGAWAALKITADITDAAASVIVDPDRVRHRLPEDFPMPQGGLNIRLPASPFAADQALEQELRLFKWKQRAAVAFARANGFDRIVIGASPQAVGDSTTRRLGIIAAGKSFPDTMQALAAIGIGESEARRLGITLYKPGLVWPLEPEGAKRFAAGLEEILIVEEKRPVIEPQLKELLYDLPDSKRPRILGKHDEDGAWLLPPADELSPLAIAEVIVRRLSRIAAIPEIEARLAQLVARERALAEREAPARRLAYFCSGCPHNTSTKVPEGSKALAGIGCHYMALWMDRDTATFTQMGGEGGTWIGRAPFSKTPHMFQNMGDGTYFHSGSMTIRAAVAAGTNITYKILFNDAVAMTGGQPMDGNLNVPILARQLAAEGVGRIAVVSETPENYGDADIAAPARLYHRDLLDEVSRELRDVPGVTAIIYDQTCAAEKRRRRKRGLMVDPPKRVFINEAVCEGCGDCSDQSNCLSVTPVETEFGRKRKIDQSSCNKDFSCVKGFCPSFVTVHGGSLRKPAIAAVAPDSVRLPEPVQAPLDRPYGILVTGIGGTGVVTIGALIGMAAHLEGKGASVFDVTGLSQKGGAVMSHVRIARDPGELHAVRLPSGGADLILGCDLMVSGGADALGRMDAKATRAIVNEHQVITGDFTRDADWQYPERQLKRAIETAAASTEYLDAAKFALRKMGDAIFTNPIMLGFAFQRGLIPVGAEAIERAIAINAVAVEANLRAFRLGRQAALDASLLRDPAPVTTIVSLPELVQHRMRHLSSYQNAALADRYRLLVERVAKAEGAAVPGSTALATAVARNYAKLLSYKDEYEVARLYSDGSFREKLEAEFAGDYRLEMHLAPSWLAKPGPDGRPAKRSFGPWMLRAMGVLARLKGLRGTALDVFGRSAERQLERRLIGEYEATIETILAGLRPDNHRVAVALAELPAAIRGYGPIKEASVEFAARRQAELLSAFREAPAQSRAAE